MFDHERSLVQRFAGQPFVLLGVNGDDDPEKQASMERKARLTWPSVFDGPGRGITHAWDVRAFPTLVLLDQSGVIRFRCEGEPQQGTLERKIEELLRDGLKDKQKS